MEPTASEIPLVGIHQIGFHGAIDEDDIQCRTRQMIARSLNTRSIIAFVGSGISTAYKHTDWDSFAASVVKFTLENVDREILGKQPQHKKALASYHRQKRRRTHQSTLARSDQTLVMLDLCDELFAKEGPAAHQNFRNEIASIISEFNDLQ